MHREPGGPATSYTDPMSWDSHLTYDRCVRINRGGVCVSIGGVYMYHEGVCAYQSPKFISKVPSRLVSIARLYVGVNDLYSSTVHAVHSLLRRLYSLSLVNKYIV
jgi:hypothetical protein